MKMTTKVLGTYDIVGSPGFYDAELCMELDDNILKFYVNDFCKKFNGKGVLRLLPIINDYNCISHILNYEMRKKDNESLDVLILTEYERVITRLIFPDKFNVECRVLDQGGYKYIHNYDLIIVLNKTIPINFHHSLKRFFNEKRRNGDQLTKIIYLPKTIEYIKDLEKTGFYCSDSNWSEQTYNSDLREHKLERIIKNN